MNFKLLKNKDFSLLIAGHGVSLVGSNMQQFALSLYVLAITGSATIFATVVSISILPRLILSPIAGVFGDWFDRKKSIVTLDLINGLIIGIFAVIFIKTGELSLPMIYILVIALEITEIFFQSAMSAVLPSIVEKEQLVEANSLSSIVMSFGNLFAPFIAGALYGTFGMAIILLVNSLSFIFSAISEMFISIPKTHKKPDKISFKTFKDDLVDGISIVKDNKMIKSIIGLAVILNFCLSPVFAVGLTFIIKEILQCSDFQFGLLQSILALSMMLAPILCGGILKKFKLGKLLVVTFTIVSGLFGLIAVVSTDLFINMFEGNLVPYMVILAISFIVGMGITIVNIAVSTMFQTLVPIEYMGRASTVLGLLMTIAMPIGQILFGVLYDKFPMYIGVSLAGIIMMLDVIVYRKVLLEADKSETGELCEVN